LSRIRQDLALFFAAIVIAKGEIPSAEADAKSQKSRFTAGFFVSFDFAYIIKRYERRFDISWSLGDCFAIFHRQCRNDYFLQQSSFGNGAGLDRLLEFLRLS
jgi:hypothetical protein